MKPFAMGLLLTLFSSTGCLFDREVSCPENPRHNLPCFSEGTFCGYGSSACGFDEECRCRGGFWTCVRVSCASDLPDVLVEESPGGDAAFSTDLFTSADETPDPPNVQDAGSSTCPPVPPIGDPCATDRRCEYGEECCCGQCFPSQVCECREEVWVCLATDACLIPGCTDVMADVPVPDVPPEPGPDAEPLPVGRCREPQDCPNGMALCRAPDAPPLCGICARVEHPCVRDEDCRDVPGSPVCAPSRRACLCEPGASECQPRCDDPIWAVSCHPVTERCDGITGRCEPRTCRGAEDCPVNHRCPIPEVLPCERLPCRTDDDCDVGFCVLGHCHAEPGICELPRP